MSIRLSCNLFLYCFAKWFSTIGGPVAWLRIAWTIETRFNSFLFSFFFVVVWLWFASRVYNPSTHTRTHENTNDTTQYTDTNAAQRNFTIFFSSFFRCYFFTLPNSLCSMVCVHIQCQRVPNRVFLFRLFSFGWYIHGPKTEKFTAKCRSREMWWSNHKNEFIK